MSRITVIENNTRTDRVMNEQKNLILTIVISVTILFGWQLAFPPAQVEPQSTNQAVGSQPTLPSLSSDQVMVDVEKSLTVSDALEQSEATRVAIENAELSGSISLKGARFDDLRLSSYKKELNGEEAVDLFAPSGTDQAYFAEFGWIPSDKSVAVPNHNTVWTADKEVLTSEQPITLSWTNPVGITFRMEIALDEHYLFNVKQSVENNSY